MALIRFPYSFFRSAFHSVQRKEKNFKDVIKITWYENRECSNTFHFSCRRYSTRSLLCFAIVVFADCRSWLLPLTPKNDRKKNHRWKCSTFKRTLFKWPEYSMLTWKEKKEKKKNVSKFVRFQPFSKHETLYTHTHKNLMVDLNTTTILQSLQRVTERKYHLFMENAPHLTIYLYLNERKSHHENYF